MPLVAVGERPHSSAFGARVRVVLAGRCFMKFGVGGNGWDERPAGCAGRIRYIRGRDSGTERCGAPGGRPGGLPGLPDEGGGVRAGIGVRGGAGAFPLRAGRRRRRLEGGPSGPGAQRGRPRGPGPAAALDGVLGLPQLPGLPRPGGRGGLPGGPGRGPPRRRGGTRAAEGRGRPRRHPGPQRPPLRRARPPRRARRPAGPQHGFPADHRGPGARGRAGRRAEPAAVGPPGPHRPGRRRRHAHRAHARRADGSAARRAGGLLGVDGRAQDGHAVLDAAGRGGGGPGCGGGRAAGPGRGDAEPRTGQPAVQRPDRLRAGVRRPGHPRGLRPAEQPGLPRTARLRARGPARLGRARRGAAEGVRPRPSGPAGDAARPRGRGRGAQAHGDGGGARRVPQRAERAVLRRDDRTQGPPHRPAVRDAPEGEGA